jgi:integrase
MGARCAEIDLDAKSWTIPGERMKSGREHRVPLTDAALRVLETAQGLRTTKRDSEYVFPGAAAGRPLSVMAMAMVLRRMKRGDLTVHGFRSTFRDWAAERTNYPAHVVEMALAHAVENKVEAAYRRGDLFEKRRRLMKEWATFSAQLARGTGDNVSQLRPTSP